jgi:hypothetical protein
MLVFRYEKAGLKELQEFFIWEFKIGDNIKYNLDIIFNLVEDYNTGKNYKKPISILCVSVIEAIMVDFIYRLYRGTKHFPEKLKDREDEIKDKLSNAIIKKKKNIDGSVMCFLKNFGFSEMIDIYRNLKLFGDDSMIYDNLSKMVLFRNRIHINNYHGNFEKDEINTFSEKRAQFIINAMEWIFQYFFENYQRKWYK